MEWGDLFLTIVCVVFVASLIALLWWRDSVLNEETTDYIIAARRKYEDELREERDEDEDDELGQLRQENERLQAEIAELRKWVPYRKGVSVVWGDN